MHFINFITEFFSRKPGKDKKTMFIQFITFGLFGAVTVFTYVPKDTEPLTITVSYTHLRAHETS